MAYTDPHHINQTIIRQLVVCPIIMGAILARTGPVPVEILVAVNQQGFPDARSGPDLSAM